MRRLSHDTQGIGQRIFKAHEAFEVAMDDVQQVWKDDRSRDFFQRYTGDVATTIRQLTTTLSAALEAFEQMSQQLQDPDRR